jgi:outer membrane protein assembly factor BamB
MVEAAPVLGPNGTIFATSFDGHLYALSADTGATMCTYDAQSLLRAAPVVTSDGLVVVASYTGAVYAINSSCEEVWRCARDWLPRATRLGMRRMHLG